MRHIMSHGLVSEFLRVTVRTRYTYPNPSTSQLLNVSNIPDDVRMPEIYKRKKCLYTHVHICFFDLILAGMRIKFGEKGWKCPIYPHQTVDFLHFQKYLTYLVLYTSLQDCFDKLVIYHAATLFICNNMTVKE